MPIQPTAARLILAAYMVVLYTICLDPGKAFAETISDKNIPQIAATTIPQPEITGDNQAIKETKEEITLEKADFLKKPANSNQSASRGEMTVILNALANSLQRDLSRIDAQKSDKNEVQVLTALHQQLTDELTTLGVNVQGLQGHISVIEGKNTEQDKRLSLLEKVQLHGDMVFGGLADMSSGGTGSRGGMKDAMSAMGRLRLSIDAPIIEDKDNALIGNGVLHTRLIGAFGRFARLGSHSGNLGADYPFNIYSRVTADVSSANEGLGTGSVGNLTGLAGNTFVLRPNIYLESAFYTQHFKPGIPLLTNLGMNHKGANWKASGDLYAGVARWWDLFDVSPYRGNELTQFQNNAFINIPGIAVNIAQPMIAYQWHQGLGQHASLDVGTALGTLDPGDVMDGLNATYEARLNYTTALLGAESGKPGSLYAGAYHIFPAGSRYYNDTIATLTNRSGQPSSSLTQRSVGSAVYMGWNQEWAKGIGTNFGYLFNNSSSTITGATTLQPGPATVVAGAKQTFSGVLSVPVSTLTAQWMHKEWPANSWLNKDHCGVGYSFSQMQKDGLSGSGFKDALEHVVEVYYRRQINDNFALIPSVQLIRNRLGLDANDWTTVLSLRMSYIF